jgi:hypothetical protein
MSKLQTITSDKKTKKIEVKSCEKCHFNDVCEYVSFDNTIPKKCTLEDWEETTDAE